MKHNTIIISKISFYEMYFYVLLMFYEVLAL